MTLSKIYRENGCLYLIQDISDTDIYERSKALVQFCDKETKLFEKEIDRAILEIFERNGINIPNTSKSVLKWAFDLLNRKNKDIVITDLYEKSVRSGDDRYYLVKKTKNGLTVMLEDNKLLQCGVEIREVEYA